MTTSPSRLAFAMRIPLCSTKLAWARLRHLTLGFGALTAALGIVPVAVMPLAGQTRFAWTVDSTNFTRYRTIEDCLARIARVRDSVEWSGSTWRDTLSLSTAAARAPLPKQVLDIAERCAAPFGEREASLSDFVPLLQLYLLAGRDADAKALTARRLAAIPAKATHERAAVLDSAIHAYIDQWGVDLFESRMSWRPQPARVELAEPLLTELNALPAVRLRTRLDDSFLLNAMARAAGDTARARRTGEEIVGITSKLTAAEWRAGEVNILLLYNVIRDLHESAAIDSLRRGTAAFTAVMQAAWAGATGERPDAILFPIGKPAVPIEADFWYGRGDTITPRPTKGKVALVVFFSHRCLRSLGAACWPLYVKIERLAKRFPEVEITLVTNTLGYLSSMSPPSPATEAEAMRRWLLVDRKLPVTLAVTNTAFWRLPNPDRRRIDSDVPNVLHYGWGGWGSVGYGASYLIDQTGMIVDVTGLDPRNSGDEDHFGKIIETLLARQTASR